MEGFPKPSAESEPNLPKISKEEWDKHCRSFGSELDTGEQAQWMSEKGISFDSGLVEVELDGEKVKMQTARDDFGTIAES